MWAIYALGASLMWGLTYIINEQLFKKISVMSTLAITIFVSSLCLIVFAYFEGFLKRDIAMIMSSNRLMWLTIAGIILFVIAELGINFSISNKNASVASLIEISYPIFVVLFSWIIFKQLPQHAIGTTIGGLLIFIGVAVVYYFNR